MTKAEQKIGKIIGVASAIWLLYTVFKPKTPTNSNFDPSYHDGNGYGGGKPTLETPK